MTSRAHLLLPLAALLLAACTTPPPATEQAPASPAPTEAPRERDVSVQVLGPAGRVAGATVCASRPRREEVCARSGDDGVARLGLLPGTYSVRATAAERRLASAVVTADLAVDSAVTVLMEGRALISGIVRDDRGRAVAGADVCAHPASEGRLECEHSGSDGKFTVEVIPGVYKLELHGPDDGSRLITQWAFGRVGSFEADPLDVRRGDLSGLEVSLIRGVVLSGVVTAVRDGSVVKDAQVCTLTFAAPLPWDCERTDDKGRYAALREPGTYWVWTIPPGERGSRLIAQRYDRALTGFEASAFPLSEDRRLDVALGEGTILRGRVSDSLGKPLVLAFVCVDTPFPTGRICRSTGDDGSYEIATRPETYVINVVPPDESAAIGGYWSGKRDWTEADRFRIGTRDLVLDIVLPLGVRLTGQVRTPVGQPVEGATVNVNDPRGVRVAASTDIHGRYSVALPPGEYTLDVFAPRVVELRSVVGQDVVVQGDIRYDVILPPVEP